jgi:hypothetical protein
MTNTSRTEVERVAEWLDAKWKRHGEPEDKEAAAILLALATERDALREVLGVVRARVDNEMGRLITMDIIDTALKGTP